MRDAFLARLADLDPEQPWSSFEFQPLKTSAPIECFRREYAACPCASQRLEATVVEEAGVNRPELAVCFIDAVAVLPESTAAAEDAEAQAQ